MKRRRLKQNWAVRGVDAEVVVATKRFAHENGVNMGRVVSDALRA